jgi:hypothetical protein
MTPPETRYAKSGDVHIAYQVVGERPARPFGGKLKKHLDENFDAGVTVISIIPLRRVAFDGLC